MYGLHLFLCNLNRIDYSVEFQIVLADYHRVLGFLDSCKMGSGIFFLSYHFTTLLLAFSRVGRHILESSVTGLFLVASVVK